MTIHEESWKTALSDEFSKPYFEKLISFVESEYENGNVFPPQDEVFTALERTPLHKVKCVILGQDPYHEEGQAHGLCFSVKPGVKVPPSLVNIYKELKADLNCNIPNNGYLTKWADQGVLMLNTVLTVKEGAANSHKGKGWEKFTDACIRAVNAQDRPIVFLLWGGPAGKKESMLSNEKHLVLKAAHPSPLSVYRGFSGCGHFSKANAFLTEHGLAPIDWQIEDI